MSSRFAILLFRSQELVGDRAASEFADNVFLRIVVLANEDDVDEGVNLFLAFNYILNHGSRGRQLTAGDEGSCFCVAVMPVRKSA